MKKQSLLACMPVLILSTALLGGCGEKQEFRGIPGGENPESTTDPFVVEAANFAVKAQALAMQKTNETQAAKISLLSITSAKKQVVAGLNYRLVLKVKLDDNERIAEAVVFLGLSSPEAKELPYELTSWNWQ